MHAEAAVAEVIARLEGARWGAHDCAGRAGQVVPLQVADHLHRVNVLAIDGIRRVSLGRGARAYRTRPWARTAGWWLAWPLRNR